MQEPKDTQTYAKDSATSSPINTGLTQRRSAPVLRAGKVYFIKCRHAIKIGFSLAPAIRIVELQNGSPHDLKLLGWVAGTTDTERSLHEQFSEYKIRGEWFRAHPSLLSFIEKSAVKYDGRPELERPTIGFELEATRRTLIARRVKTGADTPDGRTCSNLVEQLQEMQTYVRPNWAQDERQTLPWLIKQQMKRLAPRPVQ